MKTANKKNIDPMTKARTHKIFDDYSKEARSRIVLATEIYKVRTKKGVSQQELVKQIKTTQKIVLHDKQNNKRKNTDLCSGFF